ncbi:MAG: hypothetical protein OEM01_06595 [Desulfobulbaceae bacterium]|nr:hypothetical protein [Desulfobulbaceae bacterium]
MKYKLSFCEFKQLSDNIFEVTINAGAIIDEKFAEEAEVFWRNLTTEPYGLLVNNKNRFSYSFMGLQKIGEHSLERKTAVLVDDPISKDQITTVLDLKKTAGNAENRKFFQDSDEAIKRLKSP